MATIAALFGVLLVLSVIMTAAWWIALKSGHSGWIDAIWSYASGLVGASAALIPITATGFGGDIAARQWIVAGLAAVWGIRLGSHIAARNLKSGDDPRYAALKVQWGADYPRQLFLFLQIQAIAAFVLALATFFAGHAPGPLGLTDWLGVAILVAAIIGEAVSDAQLARFRADPANRGKICDIGLWSWSRHPNYFFEWLTWCAYPVIAIGSLHVYPISTLTLLAPIMMYWLLVHVSGVPPLEDHMRKSRGSAFEAYAARVSLFWPLPPRRA